MSESRPPLFTEATGVRDASWVQQAIAGDADAFGQLITAYERPAVATAYRLLGNSDDARDIAQEAFLRAYRSLANLKEPNRFGPWLLRIVSNLSLNARRSRRSATVVRLEEDWGTEGATTREGGPAKSSPPPEQEVETRELQEALDAALAQLPEKQRLALVLFTMEGWAQKDIANVLECSLETVKWNVFQARKKLREILGDLLID